jgi:nitrogen fixation/metabolism regulation signal transduction histidine kinase
VAFSSIGMTMGTDKTGFGGSHESIDHIKGNKDESWHVVVSLDEEKAIELNYNTTLAIIFVGIIFTLLTTVIAPLLGKWVARPIVKLASAAQIIGQGELDTRVALHSSEEITSLSSSFNKMVKNIQDSITSKDELMRLSCKPLTQRKQRKKRKRLIVPGGFLLPI